MPVSVFIAFCVCIGDEEEWDQQCVWHSELVSGLDKVDVWVEQLQQDQDKWTTQKGDWATTLHVMVRMALRFISGTVAELVTDTARSGVCFSLRPLMPNRYKSQHYKELEFLVI